MSHLRKTGGHKVTLLFVGVESVLPYAESMLLFNSEVFMQLSSSTLFKLDEG